MFVLVEHDKQGDKFPIQESMLEIEVFHLPFILHGHAYIQLGHYIINYSLETVVIMIVFALTPN